MKCKTCKDKKEIRRYKANGYDRPLTPEMVPCPLCSIQPTKTKVSGPTWVNPPRAVEPSPLPAFPVRGSGKWIN